MPHELPIYPKDHLVGVVVPVGGSNCAKCEYVSGQYCKQPQFIEWNGSNKIPAPTDRYCCDFFETADKDDTKSPHGFPSLKSLRKEAGVEGESVATERKEYKEGGE
jgi:hypothetical protein